MLVWCLGDTCALIILRLAILREYAIMHPWRTALKQPSAQAAGSAQSNTLNRSRVHTRGRQQSGSSCNTQNRSRAREGAVSSQCFSQSASSGPGAAGLCGTGGFDPGAAVAGLAAGLCGAPLQPCSAAGLRCTPLQPCSAAGLRCKFVACEPKPANNVAWAQASATDPHLFQPTWDPLVSPSTIPGK